MGFLSGIFKKKIDADKAFNTITGGIDKIFFTNQERSEATQKAFNEYVEWYKLTIDESTAKSLTRRYIAILMVASFLILLLGSGVAYYFDINYAVHLWELSKTIIPYVGGIMLFYFGYYGVMNVIKAKKK